jgi:uncharacterized delta-60 repeat protein
MKKKSSARSAAFFSRRALSCFGCFIAVLLVLLAKGNTRPLAHEHSGPSQRSLFTPAGTPQEAWVATYNGPGNVVDEAKAMAVDNSGNVYVTGRSGGGPGTSFDYATVKYNSAGQEQWVARYNGPDNGDDHAEAIAVDNLGNVYVTGTSSTDYATIKYDSAGQEQWVARYNSGFGLNEAYALVFDGSGNVYVTGASSGANSAEDYTTIKYNSAGQQQWVARYNGPQTISTDYALAIAIDGSGNIYVTGQSDGSGTGADYATVKYNSAGQQQWVARYNGPGNGTDAAFAIAVDDSGSVYITGDSFGSGTDFDYGTIKYNASGQEQWVARYNGPGNGFDFGIAIAVDDSGNVYVTGSSEGSVTSDDYATVKYDSAGQQQWVSRYNGPANNLDVAYAIAVDDSGSVYVTGYSDAPNTAEDYATIKYNSGGQQQWVVRYNGPDNLFDDAYAIAIDSSGNIYVTGESSTNYVTIKYEQGGTPAPTPTATPTPTPTSTPSLTPTPTVTPTPSVSPGITPRPRPTPHARPTPP